MANEKLVITLNVEDGTLDQLQDGNDALAQALKGHVAAALALASNNLVQRESLSRLEISALADGMPPKHKGVAV